MYFVAHLFEVMHSVDPVGRVLEFLFDFSLLRVVCVCHRSRVDRLLCWPQELQDLLHSFLSAHDIIVVNTTALSFKEFASDYWKTLYFERFGYMDTTVTKFKQLFCQAQCLTEHMSDGALTLKIFNVNFFLTLKLF